MGGTHMFGRIGRRTRVGLITLGLIAASALGLSAGSAPAAAVGAGPGYLALGDSVVFGYITQAGYEYGNANNFVGYPAYVGADLKLNTVNASCPGEATTGFKSPPPAADNGCRSFRTFFPLHVSYKGTQLAFATSFLAAHPETRLVTIGIGANDLFILQRNCATATNPALCLQAGLTTLLPQITANMDTILKALRAHFHGLLVVVNYYSLDYTDFAGTAVTRLLNQAGDGASACGWCCRRGRIQRVPDGSVARPCRRPHMQGGVAQRFPGEPVHLRCAPQPVRTAAPGVDGGAGGRSQLAVTVIAAEPQAAAQRSRPLAVRM